MMRMDGVFILVGDRWVRCKGKEGGGLIELLRDPGEMWRVCLKGQARLNVFVFLLMLVLLVAAGFAAESSGAVNPASYLPLTELLRKWGEKSVESVQQAAEAGDASAQHYLGYCYSEGIRVQVDGGQSVRWYERAGKAGYLPSWNNLGLLYQRGKGVPMDFAKASEYFHRAADGGLPKAHLNLGFLFQAQGQQEQAVTSFRRATELGEYEAAVQLYFAYTRGQGVRADRSAAIMWLTTGAEGGNAYAQTLLGYYYNFPQWERTETGNRLPPPRMDEAVRWYQRAVEQNWSGAQYHLGLCYLSGDGVDLDEEQGLELIRKASDQKHVYAMIELAHSYSKGIGKPRDGLDEPISILKRVVESASEKDRSEIGQAYEDLVLRYEHGVGTQRDLVAAVEWYCRAARAGFANYSMQDPRAVDARPEIHYQGFLSEPGRSIIIVAVPDGLGRTEAFSDMLSLYLRAARGDGGSALLIAKAYLSGRDVPNDRVKAWLWLSLANSAEVSDLRTRCEASMTAEQIEKARTQSPEFKRGLSEVSQGSGFRPGLIER